MVVKGIPSVDSYNVSPDSLNLLNALQKALDTVVSVYGSFEVPLPSRRYWTTGKPAYDCEQVTVSFIQAYLGFPGGDGSQATNCNVPRSAVFEIAIVRPMAAVGSSGLTPSPENIQKASEWPAVDAWVLLESLNDFDNWDPMGGRGPGVIATVRAEDAAGGYISTVMQLTVAIP